MHEKPNKSNGYFLHVMLPPCTVYYFTSIKGDVELSPILAADQAQISRLTMDEVHMYDDGRSAPPGVPERLNVTCVQRRGNSCRRYLCTALHALGHRRKS